MQGLLASLKEENTRLHEALDHDPQGKLLKKLHDDLQVVRTGVMDMSGEMRRVNEQLPDPASRVGELEVCMSLSICSFLLWHNNYYCQCDVTLYIVHMTLSSRGQLSS